MRNKLKFFFLCILILLFPVFASALEFEGEIKDAGGQSVPEVYIISDVGETVSDKAGLFKLKEKPNYLFFIKEKLQPVFVKPTANQKQIRIVLKNETPDQIFRLPACKSNIDKLYGEFIKIAVSDRKKLKESSSDDYQAFSVMFGEKSDQSYLNEIHGSNAVSLVPFFDHIKNTENFAVNSIYFEDKLVGEDWRGKTADGKYWRKLRVFSESIWYEVGKTEPRDFFDQIIAGTCFNTEHFLWKKSKEK